MKTLYLGADDAMAARIVQFMRGKEIKPDSFAVLEVLHDDDCPKVNGGQRCECRPDFRLGDGAA
jgi:hypothetical protein